MCVDVQDVPVWIPGVEPLSDRLNRVMAWRLSSRLAQFYVQRESGPVQRALASVRTPFRE